MSHPFRIVVLNGEIAGAMAVAALARQLPPNAFEITAVNLPRHEASFVFGSSFPSLVGLHQMLGLKDNVILRAAHGTYKLSTKIAGLTSKPFHHAYSATGKPKGGHGFHHHYIAHALRGQVSAYHTYGLAAVAAEAGQFVPPTQSKPPPFAACSYAYHLDLAAYDKMLGQYVSRAPIKCVSGEIEGHSNDPETGHVASVKLKDGTEVSGDLFLDASGDRRGLWADHRTTDYRSDLCNRILTARCPRGAHLPSYTALDAGPAGWLWRIPLRDHLAVGYAYNAEMEDDDAASRTLIDRTGVSEADIRTFSLANHRPGAVWQGNLIAIGNTAGFVEPFEGMHLHLIQSSLARLVTLLPRDAKYMRVEAREYNRVMGEEYARAADYMVAHQVLSQSPNTEFWRAQRSQQTSDELARKLTQFRSRARLVMYDNDPFQEESWLALLLGHGLLPNRVSPLLSGDVAMSAAELDDMSNQIRNIAQRLPEHAAYLKSVIGQG